MKNVPMTDNVVGTALKNIRSSIVAKIISIRLWATFSEAKVEYTYLRIYGHRTSTSGFPLQAHRE